jgi:MFS transporter, SP family, galactose:H+ symporter
MAVAGGAPTGIPSTAIAHSPLVDVPEAGLKQIRRWGLVIVIGSFLFGYDTGVVSGALLFIKTEFHLDSVQQGSVVSVLLLGAMVGALFVGRASDGFGRRPTLGVLGVVFGIGVALAALANGYALLMLGRVVMGLGVGGVSATVPTYLSEIAPAQIRGRLLTLNQLLITVGLLAAYVVNLVFSSSKDWRAMFWVALIPSVALVLGTLRLPESPAWLINHGRIDAARKMLGSVAGVHGADHVIERYRGEEEQRRREQQASRTAEREGMRALLAPRLRPALAVGLTLAVVQQFGGINTILYYAPTIMQETGLSASNSIFYSVAIGVINLAMTIVSLRLVDRVGRRALLLISLTGMLLSLVLLGLAFVADLSSVITLLCMLLYIVAFAIGMGPVFWVLLGEIFPASDRAEGAGAGSTMNWAANFAVSLAFLPLVKAIGQGETFWLFAVICGLGMWFVSRYVPETRDRNFGEIDRDLQTRWRGADPAGVVGRA